MMGCNDVNRILGGMSKRANPLTQLVKGVAKAVAKPAAKSSAKPAAKVLKNAVKPVVKAVTSVPAGGVTPAVKTVNDLQDLVSSPSEKSLNCMNDRVGFELAVRDLQSGKVKPQEFIDNLREGTAEEYERNLKFSNTIGDAEGAAESTDIFYRKMQNLDNLEKLDGLYSIERSTGEDIGIFGSDAAPYTVISKPGYLVKKLLFKDPAMYDAWMNIRKQRIDEQYTNRKTHTHPVDSKYLDPFDVECVPDFYAADMPVRFALLPGTYGNGSGMERGYHKGPQLPHRLISLNDGTYEDTKTGKRFSSVEEAYEWMQSKGFGANYLHVPIVPRDYHSFNRVFSEEALHALLGQQYGVIRGWDGVSGPYGIRLASNQYVPDYLSLSNEADLTLIEDARVKLNLSDSADTFSRTMAYGGDKGSHGPGANTPFHRYVYWDPEFMRAKATLSIAFMNAGYDPAKVMAMSPEDMRKELANLDSKINSYIWTSDARNRFGKHIKDGPAQEILNNVHGFDPVTSAHDAFNVLAVDQDYANRIRSYSPGGGLHDSMHLSQGTQPGTGEKGRSVDEYLRILRSVLENDRDKYANMWRLQGLLPPALASLLYRYGDDNEEDDK